jgi:hypothetical protein
MAQARRFPVLEHLRGASRWLVFVLAAIALALIPWTAYLSATLPGEHVAHHWDVAWAGFDVFEAAALTATLIALVRRSARLPVFAAIAGTALITDAWFDLLTASPGHDRGWALVQAVLGELPLAALCYWLAYDSADATVSADAAPRRLRQLALQQHRRQTDPAKTQHALVQQVAGLPAWEELRVEAVKPLDLEDRIGE